MKVFLKRPLVVFIILLMALFLLWRFIRPMNIFIVDERFAWPVDTSKVPEVLGELSASDCAACHPDFFSEWQTSIHSQAWTDPYFQVDWVFDGSQYNCRLCHTPLDRQQPQTVLHYRDEAGWDPVLQDNPDFDLSLQHEGVTCAACHFRDGKIIGVFGDTDAPHAVQKIDDPNRVCVRCHIVEGDRWDTFFHLPPCGTVAEIRSSRADDESLGCVECHMPLLERPLVVGGDIRRTRQHLWRGGHDQAMVKNAITFDFSQDNQSGNQKRVAGVQQTTVVDTDIKKVFRLTMTNTGAAHYVPTGTPDRHLTVNFYLRNAQGALLDEAQHTLKRTLMWRPFIIDLWDTRLKPGQPQNFEYMVDTRAFDSDKERLTLEVVVKYHLLDENRRERIGYENTQPISYVIYQDTVILPFNREK